LKPTLNILGCGTVGRTLGLLWHQSHSFKINHLYSRTKTSAASAQTFIGAGTVQTELHELAHANAYLISTSDDQIKAVAENLARTNMIREGDLVFHCSGALSSDVLLPLKNQGASIASTHPIKSFTHAKNSCESFKGTYCAIEGDEAALELLRSVFIQIGGHTLPINKEYKALYHASTTLICNYLCALMDLGFGCLEKSGLDKDLVQKAVEPLAIETLKNVFATDTTHALTGPIARGDTQTLSNQINAIKSFSDEHSVLFKELSKQALKIASRKTEAVKLSNIRDLLSVNND